MKKIKILLTLLSVLMIIGGALAFKVQQKFTGNWKCTTTSNYPTTVCPELRYELSQVFVTRSLCKTIGAPANEECIEVDVTLHP